MTNEERDLITQYIARIGGAPRAPQTGLSTGSVPATTTPLPPIDRDADALIGNLFQQYPEAKYRLTQTAFVQEHALVEAQNRIQQLQWELQQTQQALQQAQTALQQAQQQRQAAPPAASGGIFGGLFGGTRTQTAAPPPPPDWQRPFAHEWSVPPEQD